MLAEAFRSPADPSHVEYEAFADLLNEVFTMKGLQNMPGNKVNLPLQEGFPERLGWHKEGLSNVERARVREVLESLATTCASEGIDFNFLLAGYDHHKVGAAESWGERGGGREGRSGGRGGRRRGIGNLRAMACMTG